MLFSNRRVIILFSMYAFFILNSASLLSGSIIVQGDTADYGIEKTKKYDILMTFDDWPSPFDEGPSGE